MEPTGAAARPMTHPHLSKQFDIVLDGVTTRVLQMGGLVESQVSRAIRALTTLDSELATEVLVEEERVNAMEVAIDGELSVIIATRQPAAVDLRLLIAISKSIANLERVGDEAARIARTVQRLNNAGVSSRLKLTLGDLAYEAGLASTSLQRSLDAFTRLDVELALAVIKDDNSIDQEFEGLLRRLITYMMEDPRTISSSIDLVFVAKAIERGRRPREEPGRADDLRRTGHRHSAHSADRGRGSRPLTVGAIARRRG